MVISYHFGLNQNYAGEIMALTYSLKIEDNIKISDMKKILTTAPDFNEKNGEVEATDILVNITNPGGLSVQVVEDDFEFTPAVAISFRISKFAEPEVLYKRFMQAVWTVLKATKGDAVVLFNGEEIVLHRKKEKLYLNEIDNFWYEGTLPTDQQCEFKSMARV